MILVAIDTSTRWAGVGLQTDDGTQNERIWRSDQNHGRELMPAVVDLLAESKLTASDITHLAVALGPGGFSAVRVGISTVIGLAMPQGLPVIGIPTHHIEAEPFLHAASAETPLYSLLPAGRGEVSWARFEADGAEPEGGLASVEDLLTRLEPTALLCGEAAALFASSVGRERILTPDAPTRKPASMLNIASGRLDHGKETPLEKLRPIYARAPSITVSRKPG